MPSSTAVPGSGTIEKDVPGALVRPKKANWSNGSVVSQLTSTTPIAWAIRVTTDRVPGRFGESLSSKRRCW